MAGLPHQPRGHNQTPPQPLRPPPLPRPPSRPSPPRCRSRPPPPSTPSPPLPPSSSSSFPLSSSPSSSSSPPSSSPSSSSSSPAPTSPTTPHSRSWVGLGEGLTRWPTHGLRCHPCRTRLGGCTRVSGHKAYRTVDRPQTPRWRSRAGDAAVPVCMCPGASGGGGGCGTPACSIVVRRWHTWCGEVCAWCSRHRHGG